MHNKILKLFLSSLFLLGLIILPSISMATSPLNNTVKILGVRQYLNGSISIQSVGSGSIISNDGDVLTNAHVVYDDSLNRPYDAFSICVVENQEDMVECRFTATLERYDEQIDLAILSIDNIPSWGTRPSSFSAISMDTTVEPNIGDEVFVRGYPSSGGGTISLTQGQVSGFVEINGYKYLKTDADIDAGNSGGIMFDSEGSFLGVPSYIVSYYENSGRVLHALEVTKWLNSTTGNKGSTNVLATRKLREEWKRFYQAEETGKISFSTAPKISATAPDGWEFFSVSDSGFTLYKKNNELATISVMTSSNGYKYDLTSQEKLELFERVSDEDFDSHQFMKVGGNDATHLWSESSDGSAHTIILSYGHFEILIAYTVPKYDEIAILKEVNTFLSNFNLNSPNVDDPNPKQILNVSGYPYLIEVPSDWRIVLDYLEGSTLAYGLTNIDKLESAEFYYGEVPEGAPNVSPGEGLEYEIDNYIPEDANVTFQQADLQIDGLPGWILIYEEKKGSTTIKTVRVTVLDDSYELYFDYSSESDIFDNGLNKFVQALKTINTDTNGGGGKIYIPLPNQESTSGLSDISGHRYKASIENLVEMEVIGGYPDGSFKPENPVNRAEALKIILQGLRSVQSEGGEDVFVMPGNFNMFSDLKSDEWYATYVAEGVDKKIINGYPDGTFKGGNTVNLAEALKMTLEAYGAEIWEGDTSPWYKKYFDSAQALGILPNDLLDPGKLLTRAELAYIVDQLVR